MKRPKNWRFLLKKKPIILFSIVILVQIFFANNICSQEVNPTFNLEDRFHPVTSRNGMVATQEALATRAGLEVLKEGGNAIDAAVTVGFTLAVTLPRAGNLGGGGFMLIHLADRNQNLAIDYREKAPLAATKDMFLDENGEVNQKKVKFSHLSVGVPGTVAGMIIALEKYGTISLARALKPAIELASKGYPVTEYFRDSLLLYKQVMADSPPSMEIFYKPDGSVYQEGENLIQKDLAASLKLIAKNGKDAFYRGAIAEKIVADMAANGGIITKADLAKYEPVIRQPVTGNYRGYELISMPPPSSGGIHLIQILNILERFRLGTLGHNTAQAIHLMTESMKLAYADRSKYLGDSDFVSVPIRQLTSKKYADKLRRKINYYRATPAREIAPGNPYNLGESNQTTHYSVIDRSGNAVANTYTLNFNYGTGITVPGTGILLNNEMDDFVAKPGIPNDYGLIGGAANAIAPEKRMLSSMTPTIVLKDNQPFLITGSPGGSKIITTVVQIITNVIDYKMNVAEATNAVRFHHQWFPDRLEIEQDLNGDTIRLLTRRGHNIVKTNAAIGSTQSIMKLGDRLYGASDPRRLDALTLGY